MSITLTTAQLIKSVLGNGTTVAYDHLVLGPFTMDPIGQTISGNVRITASSAATMQPIVGTFRMSVPSSELVIEVQQLDFYRRIVTTSGQNNAILANIETAQKAIEDGMVTLGVIAGTRVAGV